MGKDTLREIDETASQAICQDLPNDAEEHYWSWVNAPKSTPNQYRHCMICDRIDASEWLEDKIQEARVEENRISYHEVSKRYRGFGVRHDYNSPKYVAEGKGIMLKTGQAQKLLDARLKQLQSDRTENKDA